MMYPPAAPSGTPATVYGPLPDHGFRKDQVSVVLHTTETVGMPSFDGGDTAPHYVYDPRDRSWVCFAEYGDGWVGTLVGHSSAGHGNCQAFQVEILAYSDGSLAPDHGWWVGDFTEGHYRDLADFMAWARATHGIGLSVTPAPDGGWLYGTGSPHRMNTGQWYAFSGLTAHGAVPGNRHWDTGVLDLARIDQMSKQEGSSMLVRAGDMSDGYEEISWLLVEYLTGTQADVNQPSSVQMQAVLGKESPRMVSHTDFDHLADATGMHQQARDRMHTDGLWLLGKEVAALRSVVYRSAPV